MVRLDFTGWKYVSNNLKAGGVKTTK